jgi:uncharacterized membrane protein YdbT with pleckstrin-like domain
VGYVQQNLLPGEEIEYQAQLHPLIYAPAAVLLFLTIVLVTVGLWPVGLVSFVLAAIAGAKSHLTRTTSEFVVTNRRVLIKVGVLSRHTLEMLLQRVETVGVDQTLLGRLFGYGSIVVTGTGGTHEPFRGIAQPLEFRRQVQRCAAALSEPAAVPAAAFPYPAGQALPGPFCNQCGGQNPIGSRFCSRCGSALSV